MLKYGVFHRNEAKHQSARDAELQVESGEIWGREPRGGFTLTVQAYSERGVMQPRRLEFRTDAKPGAETPYEAWWYLGEPGVHRRYKGNDEFACIVVDIISNTQV